MINLSTRVFVLPRSLRSSFSRMRNLAVGGVVEQSQSYDELSSDENGLRFREVQREVSPRVSIFVR